jgi:Mrp family chromosome partitioning ATPase
MASSLLAMADDALNGNTRPWIVAVCNQKGGVGKTTTALNLANVFADSSGRVQVVDADPQRSATAHSPKSRRRRTGLKSRIRGDVADVPGSLPQRHPAERQVPWFADTAPALSKSCKEQQDGVLLRR